jgi:hypothetical protein
MAEEEGKKIIASGGEKVEKKPEERFATFTTHLPGIQLRAF